MSSRQVGISSVDAVGSVGTYSVGTHLRLVQKINMEMIFFLSKYLYTQIHTYSLSMCTMYIQVPAFFFLPLISLSLFLSSQNFQSFTLFTITIEKHNKAQYFNVPTVVYHYIFFTILPEACLGRYGIYYSQLLIFFTRISGPRFPTIVTNCMSLLGIEPCT